MSFPLDPINAMLDRASRNAFHAARVPARVADEQEFAARVPLMTRGDFVTAFLARPDVAFAGIEPLDLTAALEKAVADWAPPN